MKHVFKTSETYCQEYQSYIVEARDQRPIRSVNIDQEPHPIAMIAPGTTLIRNSQRHESASVTPPKPGQRLVLKC